MAVGSVSLQQLLRHPYVLKVISRQRAPQNYFQRFFNVGIGAPTGTVIPAGLRAFTYDIFDHVRQLSGVRAPEAGPKRVRRNPVGVGSGYLLRSYEAMTVAYEQIANLRPLGSPIGSLDKNGQSYVTKQIEYETERMRNLREWVLTRVFRGSFTISISGDDHILADSGGQITVDFQHPSANRSQLAVGDSGANIIDVPWSNPAADIITQMLNLNKASERRTGLAIEHIFVNSTTLGWLINNLPLQQAGGAAFRVWESITTKTETDISGESRQAGKTVIFRAIPWITFHTYDGVLAPPSAQANVIPAASTDVDLVIPNGRAIMTPAPGAWLGYASGTEIVQKTYASAPESIVGFGTWQRPILEPAGREMLFLDNFFPVPFIPAAWYYATIDF